MTSGLLSAHSGPNRSFHSTSRFTPSRSGASSTWRAAMSTDVRPAVVIRPISTSPDGVVAENSSSATPSSSAWSASTRTSSRSSASSASIRPGSRMSPSSSSRGGRAIPTWTFRLESTTSHALASEVGSRPTAARNRSRCCLRGEDEPTVHGEVLEELLVDRPAQGRVLGAIAQGARGDRDAEDRPARQRGLLGHERPPSTSASRSSKNPPGHPSTRSPSASTSRRRTNAAPSSSRST